MPHKKHFGYTQGGNQHHGDNHTVNDCAIVQCFQPTQGQDPVPAVAQFCEFRIRHYPGTPPTRRKYKAHE